MADERYSGGRLLTATRLWKGNSAPGNRSLTGRLGGLPVLVMETRNRNGPDDATHVLLFGEAPKREAAER